MQTKNRKKIVKCLEDKLIFSSIASAGRYYNCSDWAIHVGINTRNGYIPKIKKTFILM